MAIRAMESDDMARHAEGDVVMDDPLARHLNDELVRQYGLLLPSAALIKVLGYPSATAYQQALVRRTMPIPMFKIGGRRGRFALSCDVALWLCRQRRGATARTQASDVEGDSAIDACATQYSRPSKAGGV